MGEINARVSSQFGRAQTRLGLAVWSSYLFAALSQAGDLAFYFILFRNLPLSQVGRFNWTMALIAFSPLILDMGLSPALVRDFSQHEGSALTVLRKVLVNRILLALVVIGLLFALLRWGRHDSQLAFLFLVAGLCQCIRSVNTGYTLCLRAFEFQGLANALSAMAPVGRGVIAIVFLGLLRQQNLETMFLWLLISEFVCSLLTWFSAKQRLGFPTRYTGPSEDGFATRLRVLVPVFAGIMLLTVIQNRLDWLIVSHYLSDVALGEYSMANKCYEILLTAVGMALGAGFPSLCRQHGLLSQDLSLFLKGVMAIGTLAAMMGALLGPELLALFWGTKYQNSDRAVRFLMIGGIVAIYDCISYQILVARNSERFILTITLVATTLQLGINLLLIRRLGILGPVVGMATLIAAVTVGYSFFIKQTVVGYRMLSYTLVLAAVATILNSISVNLWARGIGAFLVWSVCTLFLIWKDRHRVFAICYAPFGTGK